MKANRWFVSVLFVLFAIAPPSHSQVKQPSDEELKNALEKRVGQFNSALAAGDFGSVWSFLGPGLKKDNPKQRYVERLKAKIGKWELTSNPDVSLSGETTEKARRPIGQASSKVNVRTPSGQLVPINHQTTWLWFNNRGSQPAWYLARERIEEIGQEQPRAQAPAVGKLQTTGLGSAVPLPLGGDDLTICIAANCDDSRSKTR